MTTTTAAVEPRHVVDTVLTEWKHHVDAHDPDAVATVFTHDALFQGLRPTHTIGRDCVRAYYDAQPHGMTATYDVLDARTLSDRAIIAFARLTFGFVDGRTIAVHLSAIAEQDGPNWRISHYHVSRIPA
ncbi:SgcJ/EcaC family oxidoreductase [Isoptericola sp. NPDC019693]|uniref:SgcJ/EcaC family oxidoreductase n=1 Tax=Isoptericola sp. NPDC019693 TaxID=3364009 RepID=UPI0037ABFD1C